MNQILNPLYFIGFWVSMVWISRARRALKTLRHLPVVPAPLTPPVRSSAPVSVIIPAKNEENNIADCLRPFLLQNYLPYEIIVANDNSSDSTENILIRLGAVKVRTQEEITALKLKGHRLFYLNVPPTPGGWTGKNYALHTAQRLASGNWLLFTDADTRHEPWSIQQSVAYSENAGIHFLTLLPRCLAESWVEKIIQPTAMILMGLWFPIQQINDPASRIYFANGQYLLLARSLYDRIGGHQSVSGEFLEDFALMKKTKEMGGFFQCALGAEIYGTRMYNSFVSLWRGWRRIYLHSFEKNSSILLLRTFQTVFFSLTPLMLFIIAIFNAASPASVTPLPDLLLLLPFFFLWAVCAGAYRFIRSPKRFALFHPLAGLIMGGILLDAARMAILNKETRWR